MSVDTEPRLVGASTSELPSLRRRLSRVVGRLGAVGPLAVAASVLPALGALVLYGRLGTIAPWLRDHPIHGPVFCSSTFALAGGMALVPTYALSALCGWSFGFLVGLTTTLIGFVAAAMVGYAVGRAIDGGRVVDLINESRKWQAIRDAFASGGVGKEVVLVALIRLAPLAPFSLTNMIMAAVQVRPLAYAIGTLLGMAPRTAVIVFAASKLNYVDEPLAQEPWLIVVGVLSTIAVAIALAWIAKKGLSKVASVPDGIF